MPLLVAGEGSGSLAQKIAKLTSWPVSNVEFKTFPDGEDYVRILAPLKDQDVVVVQTAFPPSRLWKLLLLLNAAEENRASSIRCVVPYFAYARQDRMFLEGEPVSARLAADCIRRYARNCVTVDLHKDAVAEYFGGACQNLSAAEPFARELKSRGVDLVLAPDAGALARAREVARRIGVPHDHLEKKRISSEVVEMAHKNVEVKGRKVAVLDDIIGTGGTMARATDHIFRQGASAVVCAGVHGLFIGDVVGRLKNAGASEVFVSDTVDSPYSRVSVSELLANALVAPVRTSLQR